MSQKTKTITIMDFLTPDEIKDAQRHYAICKKTKTSAADEIHRHVIKPNIKRINAALASENDPMYLAYAVEFILSKFDITRGK